MAALTWPLSLASGASKKGITKGLLIVAGATAAGAYGAVRFFPQYNKYLMIYAGGAVGYAALEAWMLYDFDQAMKK